MNLFNVALTKIIEAVKLRATEADALNLCEKLMQVLSSGKDEDRINLLDKYIQSAQENAALLVAAETSFETKKDFISEMKSSIKRLC